MGKLHTLFQRDERRTVTDGDTTFEIVLRPLVTHEEEEIRDLGRAARLEAQARWDTEEVKRGFYIARQSQTREAIIENLLEMDATVISDLVDLAPNGGPEQEDRQKVEREANERAAAHRREVLDGMVDPELIDHAVSRDVANAIATEVNAIVLDHSLCMMVRDEAGGPLLSMERTSPDWIGGLAMQTKTQLTNAWTEMQIGRMQKSLRLAAENPTSLRRGASRNGRAASPGEVASTL